MSLEQLITSIEREAQAEADRIVGRARDQAEEIRRRARDQAQAEAEALERAHVERCRKEASQRLSQARLQARNRILAVRQELVDAVFDRALDALRAMEDDRYRDWMKRQILRLYRSDGETVVVSEADKDRLPADWLREVGRALAPEEARRPTLEFTTDDLGGGFILRHPRYDVDVSFREQVRALKEQKRAEVAAVLFEADYADVLDHAV